MGHERRHAVTKFSQNQDMIIIRCTLSFIRFASRYKYFGTSSIIGCAVISVKGYFYYLVTPC